MMKKSYDQGDHHGPVARPIPRPRRRHRGEDVEDGRDAGLGVSGEGVFVLGACFFRAVADAGGSCFSCFQSSRIPQVPRESQVGLRVAGWPDADDGAGLDRLVCAGGEIEDHRESKVANDLRFNDAAIMEELPREAHRASR